eukprot:3226176-Pyramimonas_sp.AAC.1
MSWNHMRLFEHGLVGLQASQDASPLLDSVPGLAGAAGTSPAQGRAERARAGPAQARDAGQRNKPRRGEKSGPRRRHGPTASPARLVRAGAQSSLYTVSYTHLTLPTILLL